MLNREYVILELKYLHDRETWKEGPLVFDDKPAERRKIIADAIALLKSLKPRILTLDEIDSNPEHRKEYFVEFNYYQEYMDDNGYCRVSANSDGIMVTIWMTKHVLTEDIRDYNKTWRCWSMRPTDEQREVVKWDA